MNLIYYSGVWQETDEAYEKEFIIIGAKKEDIDVSVEQGSMPMLRVSFEGNQYNDAINEGTRLPSGTSEKDVSSTYNSGVLTVTVKKAEKNVKRIAIE